MYVEKVYSTFKTMDRFKRTDKHCPCCGQFEYEEVNGYEVCEVCGWEDDPYQFENPDETGANHISLNEHRKKWQAGEIKFKLADDN